MQELGLLKGTYQLKQVHERWRKVYVFDLLQGQLNDRLWNIFLSTSRVAPGGHWLDAGCGSGDHSIRLLRRGYRCTSLDISTMVLHHAQHFCGSHVHVRFCCGALEALPFPDTTFDGVHCRGVLMHIPDWGEALGELCRVLKPGGTLIICEGNQESVGARLVRVVRNVRRPRSTLISTPGGIEFWSSIEGHPFLVRMANMSVLWQRLHIYGVKPLVLMGIEFWDIHRFPTGLPRNIALRWNKWWLGQKRWQLSADVGIVATKMVGQGAGIVSRSA